MAETAPKLVPERPLADAAPGLDGRTGPDGQAVAVAPAEAQGLITIMPGRNGRGALAERLETGLGLALPDPGHSTSGGDLHLLWAGLDKWLLQAPEMSGPALLARLDAVLDGVPAALADQSHGQVPLRVEGPGAPDLLGAGAPLDLHPAVFGVGRVAATAMSHVPVLIWRRAATGYQVLVQRGFARDLWDFLAAHVATA